MISKESNIRDLATEITGKESNVLNGKQKARVPSTEKKNRVDFIRKS